MQRAGDTTAADATGVLYVSLRQIMEWDGNSERECNVSIQGLFKVDRKAYYLYSCECYEMWRNEEFTISILHCTV